MAEYKSHYLQLGFYVDGEHKRFSNGRYVTEDKKEIEVLDGLVDVIREDKAEAKPEEKPKPEAKPAPKRAPKSK